MSEETHNDCNAALPTNENRTEDEKVQKENEQEDEKLLTNEIEDKHNPYTSNFYLDKNRFLYEKIKNMMDEKPCNEESFRTVACKRIFTVISLFFILIMILCGIFYPIANGNLIYIYFHSNNPNMITEQLCFLILLIMIEGKIKIF
jgi:hypothetical protein